MLSIKANWSEPHEANPSAYGKKINHIYKNIDLQFKKGSLVVRCSHVLNIPSWNQVIYIYTIFTCLHDPSSLTNNPYLAVNLADFQQDFPPKDSWLATQTCQDKGPKCQQWLWGYNVTTRLQGWYLKIILKKNTAHTNRIERPGFLLGDLKKIGPKSEIGRMVAGFSHHHLHKKCHLPMSFEACAIAATGFFCHTQDALTKSLANGFWGSLCMRLYYSKRIPIANLLWSPATRWCIYI